MSEVPDGKRQWKCPECGQGVLLSVTQLDPMACDACRTKMAAGSPNRGLGAIAGAANPLGFWQALPDMMKLGLVFGGLVIGLIAGFVLGQWTAMHSSASRGGSHTGVQTSQPTQANEAVEEERPEPPGPGYKWVRGRTRVDKTRGPGHWAKDPLHKADEEDDSPKKKKQ